MNVLARWKRWRQRRPGFFQYFDGQRDRFGDPFAIWRAIASHPTVNFADAASAIDEGREPETTQAIVALCEIFGVTRWDEATGTGLTDWEVANLFGDFSDYLDALKKNTNSGPISSAPSEPESSTPQEPPDEPEN